MKNAIMEKQRQVISPNNIEIKREAIIKFAGSADLSDSSSLVTSYKSDEDEQRDMLRVKEIRKITNSSTKRSKTSPSSFKDPSFSPENVKTVLKIFKSGKQEDLTQ